jgi:hypothetical protein
MEKWNSDDELVNTDGLMVVKLHHQHHTLICSGKDDSIYGYHILHLYVEANGITTEYIAELSRLVEDLPRSREKGDHTREIEDTRNYQLWVGSKQDKKAVERGDERTGLLSHSASYIRDREQRRRVKEHCARIWAVIGKIHEKLCKRYGRELAKYQKPKLAQGDFLAAPWPGMAINRGWPGASVRTLRNCNEQG